MLIPLAGLAVLVVLLLLLITSRYKVAGPNQAFIVTGRKGKAVLNPETGELSTDLSGQKVVLGGGVFVIPFVQKLATMDLSSRRISVQIRGAVSGQGIKLNVDGVAIVKVGGNADQIRLAAQRFLSQQDDQYGESCERDQHGWVPPGRVVSWVGRVRTGVRSTPARRAPRWGRGSGSRAPRCRARSASRPSR